MWNSLGKRLCRKVSAWPIHITVRTISIISFWTLSECLCDTIYFTIPEFANILWFLLKSMQLKTLGIHLIYTKPLRKQKHTLSPFFHRTQWYQAAPSSSLPRMQFRDGACTVTIPGHVKLDKDSPYLWGSIPV